jgi:hypothetical protein
MDSIKRLYGVYRGVVQDNRDPETQRRLKVQVQTTGIEVTDWAWPMEPSSIHTEVPVVGQGVWITYVGGDPEYPVWSGSFGKNKGLNKQIFIKPLANSVSLTGLTSHVVVVAQSDGTSEVDLTATIMALANKVKVLEGKVTTLEGKVTTLESQMLTKASTSHTHP